MTVHTAEGTLQKVIHECADSLNVLTEKEEKRQKDERKTLREQRQVDAEVTLWCMVLSL